MKKNQRAVPNEDATRAEGLEDHVSEAFRCKPGAWSFSAFCLIQGRERTRVGRGGEQDGEPVPRRLGDKDTDGARRADWMSASAPDRDGRDREGVSMRGDLACDLWLRLVQSGARLVG
ncbi:PDZ domain-containing protein [Psidium guajava]|nr:PDZ domain-containing protein [Psidium guajava]